VVDCVIQDCGELAEGEALPVAAAADGDAYEDFPGTPIPFPSLFVSVLTLL
jgi:hypothetical protein